MLLSQRRTTKTCCAITSASGATRNRHKPTRCVGRERSGTCRCLLLASARSSRPWMAGLHPPAHNTCCLSLGASKPIRGLHLWSLYVLVGPARGCPDTGGRAPPARRCTSGPPCRRGHGPTRAGRGDRPSLHGRPRGCGTAGGAASSSAGARGPLGRGQHDGTCSAETAGLQTRLDPGETLRWRRLASKFPLRSGSGSGCLRPPLRSASPGSRSRSLLGMSGLRLRSSSRGRATSALTQSDWPWSASVRCESKPSARVSRRNARRAAAPNGS